MANYVGQQFGNFRLLRVLGNGSFATVYLGEHIHLGTQAAIKVLKMDILHEEGEAFRAEARTIARLVHPHIVRVFDFGLKSHTPFLVMDYAPYGSLRQHHSGGLPLPLSTALSYAKQVGSALHYAHQQKVIHRDIKPENMLLGTREEVLLSDFGLALVASSSRQQVTSGMAGTIAYMAPEQIQGKPAPASDQYALGVVIYQWLTGVLPFRGSFQEVLRQHLATDPPPLRAQVAELPSAVENVVLRALAKEPDQRFASVDAFAKALQQAAEGKGQQYEIRTQPFPRPAIIPFRRTPQHALIGREQELLTLHQLLQSAQEQREQDGSSNQPPHRPYVLLLGDPGIGKTRLAEEVSLIAQQQGWAVLWGRAHPHEQHMAYRLWIDILRSALAYNYWPWQEMTDAPERYQTLTALLPELAERSSSLSPLLGETREQMQFRLWEALQAVFVAISTRSPLLIILDDLHWADSSSCTLLGYLVRNLVNQRVILIGTCRDQEISATHPLRTIFSLLQKQNMLTRMIRSPLTESQIGQLVAHLPLSSIREIQSQAAGNPFFAEELARFPNPAETRSKPPLASASPAQASSLPPGIVSVFEQHVAQLSQETQRLLNSAAVLGNAFSLDLLRLTQSSGEASGDEEMLLNQLEEALQAKLLTEESNGAEILYHFWHPLLVEYLYRRLSAARRASLHRRAAHALQELKKGQEEESASTIAYHLLNGGSESSHLAHYARLAGDHAYKLSAYPEAEKHYRLALQASGDIPDNADRKLLYDHAHLLEYLGECTLILGKLDEARQFYTQALELRKRQQSFSSLEEEQYEAQVCALLYCEIGRTWRYVGGSDKAKECFKQAELLLTSANVVGGPAWAKIRFEQSHTDWVNGDLGEALDRSNEALVLFEATPNKMQERENDLSSTLTQRVLHGDPFGMGRVYILLAGVEATLGQSNRALDHLNRALVIFEKNNVKTEIANVCCNLADLYLRRSEYALAHPILMHSYKLAEEVSFTGIAGVAAGNLGILNARLGNIQKAETWYQQALALAEQINDLFYISLWHSYAAIVLTDGGKLNEAEKFLLRALKISRSRRITLCTDFALVMSGHLRIAQAYANQENKNIYGHFLKRAIRTLRHTLSFEEREAETRIEGMTTLAEALWMQGDLDAAQRHARTALAKAQKHELVWLEKRAQHLLGTILTTSGEQEEGNHYFHQAIEHLQRCGMRLEYARALRNYGTVLVQRASPKDAAYQQGRDYLGQAWEIFLECDARLDADGVKHFLRNRNL